MKHGKQDIFLMKPSQVLLSGNSEKDIQIIISGDDDLVDQRGDDEMLCL